ncbi:hypothetical protein N4T20_14230 [Flavobacterium sp. TR2]|uniref:hypothetical protein n=1 Tax=Flavobacterium sp. TR2 TaxID=2977321 RepID=UPI0021B12CA3|nr:hypothetical protein [Flavobacterium sp. TR2]UWY26877.1 hypothetical protein N4T20_14230 [Flavobacterium sp. TR2]
MSIYKSLENTLKLMIVPNSVNINERNHLIEFNLEELEGDFYTFMNPINLNKLHSENLIDGEVKFKLERLFVLLQDIEDKDWNVDSFLNSQKWSVIQDLTTEVALLLEEF